MMIMGIRASAPRLSLLVALWWLLTGGAPATWVVGIPAVAAALASALCMRVRAGPALSARAIFPFLIFFVFASVRGGLQVAAMAVRRHPGLHPAVVELTLRLPAESERVLLASILNLLPGTLVVALDGSRLRLHVLNERLGGEAEVRRAEHHVGRLFQERLP